MENLKIKLIEGVFSSSEAAKVLTSVINSKINYHKIEVLRDSIGGSGENSNSRKRVDYLINSSLQMLEFVKSANNKSSNYEISATISINKID